MSTALELHTAYTIGVGILKIVPPLLLILGALGNGLSVVVLSRKHMRKSSTSIFLTVLAVSDLCVLYIDLMPQWLLRTFQYDITVTSEVQCKLNYFACYFFTDLSGWILVAVTFERVVLVWFPHSGKKKCSRYLAMAVIVVLMIALVGINGHLLYGIGLDELIDGNHTIATICDATDNGDYRRFYVTEWPWIDLTAFSIGPFIFLVIGNGLIIARLLYNRKKLQTHVAPLPTGQNSSATEKKRSSTIALLFALNAVYFITTTPICLYIIIFKDVNGGTEIEDVDRAAAVSLIWSIFVILMYSNNTFNFVLYFMNGEKFRKEAKALIFCKCKKENATT